MVCRKKFCFFISPTIGINIFGWTEIVVCVIRSFVMGFLLMFADSLTKLPTNLDDLSGLFTLFCEISIVVDVLIEITSVLLLIAVYKRKRQFLLTWLIIATILYVIQFLLSTFYQHFYLNDPVVIYESVVVISTVIRIYCWVFVFWFYKEVGEEENQRNTNAEENGTFVEPVVITSPPANKDLF